MVDYLSRIRAVKVSEVEAAQKREPLGDLKKRVATAKPPRDFAAAVMNPPKQLRVIAEIKRASPSAGIIRQNFNPVEVAIAYEKNGAAAISCLTDARFFGGSLSYIAEIKKHVEVPILRKDFLIDPYQVYESRAAGADAVLLIRELLTETQLESMLELTKSLGMTALIEVRSGENLQSVWPLLDLTSSPIRNLLGINNRDLVTMRTDVMHTLSLLRWAKHLDIVVSESGIRSGDHVKRLRDRGVHRILVGEHLMRQKDVGAALSKLIADSVAPKPTVRRQRSISSSQKIAQLFPQFWEATQRQLGTS